MTNKSGAFQKHRAPENLKIQSRRMTVSLLVRLVAVAGLFGGWSVTGGFSQTPLQNSLRATIFVNGQLLTGANSLAEDRAGRFFLPVAAIAVVLGDTIEMSRATRRLTVRRAKGVTAKFDAEADQILESGAPVLQIQSSADIIFPFEATELVLPVEVIAAVFDVDIRFDEARRRFDIRRGSSVTAATAATATEANKFELYRLAYDFSVNGVASSLNQNFTLLADGRLFDGRFSLATDFGGALFGRELSGLTFRRGIFLYERPGGRTLTVGDFGSGADLPFAAANLRGAAVGFPIGKTQLNAYAGLARSGFRVPPAVGALPNRRFNRFAFERNVAGFSLKRNFNFFGSVPMAAAAGLTRFGGGTVAAVAARWASETISLSLDAASGSFRPVAAVGRPAAARIGSAFDFSAAARITDKFSVQGRAVYTGAFFESPQLNARTPIKLASAGFAWQPVRWLTAAFSGTVADSPGANTSTSFVTASVNLNAGLRLPAVYFSHSISRHPVLKSSSFSLLNINQNFSKIKLSAAFSRSRLFNQAAIYSQFGAKYLLSDKNALEVTQSFGIGQLRQGFADFQTANRFGSRLTFSGGLGYSASRSTPFSLAARSTINLRLPFDTSVQANFSRAGSGTFFYLSWRGNIFRSKAQAAASDAPVGEILAYGSVFGRIYQDNNLNGKYDAETDQPQVNVIVRVDGSRVGQTDENGFYRIANLRAGVRRVNVDLLSVRADLTILDAAERETMLDGRRGAAPIDFRLVRTGRVTGIVWLDKNGDGNFEANELPLTDVRVVLAARDTLSDEFGAFALGDLPPGEYVVLLDGKTLPGKTQAGTAVPLKVKVFAGAETKIKMPVIFTPAEVKVFN